MRTFIPWATVGLILFVASMWPLFQPMEMRATLMGGKGGVSVGRTLLSDAFAVDLDFCCSANGPLMRPPNHREENRFRSCGPARFGVAHASTGAQRPALPYH